MNCDRVLSRLDGFLDERLGAADAEEIRNHLEECTACASEAEAVQEIRNRAAVLPRSLEPEHDLWPSIAQRIKEEKVVRRRFGRQSLMAAAAVLVLVGSVVTAYMVGRQQATPADPMRAMTNPGPSEITLASLERMGIIDYEFTRSELLEVFFERQDELSPETIEVVTENLEIIDLAMGRIGEALNENPDSVRLIRQLATAYRQQIDLLERAAHLPSEV